VPIRPFSNRTVSIPNGGRRCVSRESEIMSNNADAWRIAGGVSAPRSNCRRIAEPARVSERIGAMTSACA
jgi:hypothetical protein